MSAPIRVSASVAVLLALNGPARAESLFESHFAAVADGEPCYARTYSPDHLKAHPAQRVTDIEIDMTKLNPDGNPITEQNIELGFGIKVKDRPDWYTNVALCKSAGASIDCFLEGDGGKFVLESANGQNLKLTTGDYGIAIEGAEDFLELSGDKGDDRVFILSTADRSVCARSTTK